MVYRILCSCRQTYIGGTKQRLETRLREHQDACERGMMEKSGVRQRTRGTTAEGGPALSDDTCKGVLQPGKRTGLH